MSELAARRARPLARAGHGFLSADSCSSSGSHWRCNADTRISDPPPAFRPHHRIFLPRPRPPPPLLFPFSARYVGSGALRFPRTLRLRARRQLAHTPPQQRRERAAESLGLLSGLSRAEDVGDHGGGWAALSWLRVRPAERAERLNMYWRTAQSEQLRAKTPKIKSYVYPPDNLMGLLLPTPWRHGAVPRSPPWRWQVGTFGESPRSHRQLFFLDSSGRRDASRESELISCAN